ncbi:protein-tyrosine phosphatase family protein [Blastococcus sp. BMG 814]|uniref:Protein-tyrosine phosphatase family protein n=1 Tax=Blastococcus carthaginiensis TaxID=3050034 RepID=A0ABT9I916_9ACTN|nr:protein-tyrosine phosphatase family protein [Blastococcus carthaginiensis]MDP5182066.1 protein-tyrosine phosphatase family protein [Blastococcus carthaginiensis]
MDLWAGTEPGVLVLPSGRRLRGRGLRRPLPDGPAPGFGIYLLGRAPCPVPWETRWVRWPDFRLPTSPGDLHDALREALERAGSERVEVACAGGTGRTGTALACLAVLDGLPPARAVAFVRSHYRPHAIETRGQARFVARFAGN